VRKQPEHIPCPYEKWSPWNRFDPDSDDFFEDPAYEAFIEPTSAAERMELAAVQAGEQEDPILVEMREMAEDSSASSSEGSISEEGSPMAVGSDDPISLFTQAYGSRRRQEPRNASSSAQANAPSAPYPPPVRVPLPRMIRREEPRYVIPSPTRMTPRSDNASSDVSGVTQAFREMSATLPRPPILSTTVVESSLIIPPPVIAHVASSAPASTVNPIPIPVYRSGERAGWPMQGPGSPVYMDNYLTSHSPDRSLTWISMPATRTLPVRASLA